MNCIETPITAKLAEIEKAIGQNKDSLTDISISYGRMGLAYFYLYSYLYSGNEQYLQEVQAIIESVFESLGQAEESSSFFMDLIEAGILIESFFQHLQQENELGLMSDLDEIIGKYLRNQIGLGGFSPSQGAVLTGHYFLLRYKHSGVGIEYLKELLIGLDEHGCSDPDGNKYWKTGFRGNLETDLGITHGQAGIIAFLNALCAITELRKPALELLEQAVSFILLHKKKCFDNSFFPQVVEKEETAVSFCLCYGDPGVIYSLYNAGITLEKPEIADFAIQMLLHYTENSDGLAKKVRDATLIYGTSGIAVIFQKIFVKTRIEKFKTAAKILEEETLKHGNKDDKTFAGYMSYLNSPRPYTNTCFAEGLCGIAISLMALQKNELLHFVNFLGYE